MTPASNKNIDLKNRANEALMPLYPHLDIAISHGDGSYLFDMDGKKYLDCASGIAVCSLGHNNPVFNNAITEQLEKGFTMVTGAYATEPKVKAAELLLSHSKLDKIYFTNSGTEAVEGCLKLARAWAHKNKGEDCKDFIVFRNSFHGRSYGAVSGTEKSLHHPQFAPYVPGFHFAEFNNLDSVEKLITDKTCAVLVEPVQGEGGLTAGTKEFFKGLQTLCAKHKILIISDEIQAGIGRMGTLYAHDHFGYMPDLVTLAKGLGGGFPVGAFMAKKHISDAFSPGDHGSTYAGNPLATNVVFHIVSTVLKDGFLSRVTQTHDYFMSQLTALQKDIPDTLTAIKGDGLMIGIDTKFKIEDVLNALIQEGMLATQAGKNTLRLTPPLNISDSEIDEAVEKIKTVLNKTEGLKLYNA